MHAITDDVALLELDIKNGRNIKIHLKRADRKNQADFNDDMVDRIRPDNLIIIRVQRNQSRLRRTQPNLQHAKWNIIEPTSTFEASYKREE